MSACHPEVRERDDRGERVGAPMREDRLELPQGFFGLVRAQAGFSPDVHGQQGGHDAVLVRRRAAQLFERFGWTLSRQEGRCFDHRQIGVLQQRILRANPA